MTVIVLLCLAFGYAVADALTEGRKQIGVETAALRRGAQGRRARTKRKIRRRLSKLKARGPRDPGWWIWLAAVGTGTAVRTTAHGTKAAGRVAAHTARGARSGWNRGRTRARERAAATVQCPGCGSEARRDQMRLAVRGGPRRVCADCADSGQPDDTAEAATAADEQRHGEGLGGHPTGDLGTWRAPVTPIGTDGEWTCGNCGESWDITGARWDEGEAETAGEVARGAGCIACEGTLGYPGRPRSPLTGVRDLDGELDADARCAYQLAADYGTGDVRCGDPDYGDSAFCHRHTVRAVDESGDYPRRGSGWRCRVCAEPRRDGDGAMYYGGDSTRPNGQDGCSVCGGRLTVGDPPEPCPSCRARQQARDADHHERRGWEAGAMRWRSDDSEAPGQDDAQPERSSPLEEEYTDYAGRRRSLTALRTGRDEPILGSSADPHHEPGGPHMTTEQMNNQTGETIGLTSAMSFTDGMRTSCENGAAQTESHAAHAQQMAEQCRRAVASTEQSIAHMQAGEVGGSSINELQQTLEQMQAAAAAYEAMAAEATRAHEALGVCGQGFASAHSELASHTTVRDAYHGTPDAGSKQFVTNE